MHCDAFQSIGLPIAAFPYKDIYHNLLVVITISCYIFIIKVITIFAY